MNVLTRPRWDHAASKANELTADFSSPPIPVYEIAERNGVNVVFVDFGEHAESVSGLCDFKSARIYVNKDDSPERQAFTMGHERLCCAKGKKPRRPLSPDALIQRAL
ncbi:ImmA/IrrE family metallo-endopeptidase [Ruegeria pomeroyi]|uniref:ImmA/IrrE family metallo-endopeptidase n=1 Tax=Ruegeria pomeroyi TaxID=89184 RepID=UPI001FA12AA6|nr:ImmA/IrrE family metallo-endopeptidase [Ruegeria pomeroyi]